MAFILPFETEINALDEQLAALTAGDPARADAVTRLADLERRVYPQLDAYDTFLLSGHPVRPKALDYIEHIFRDVQLFQNPEVRGDHLMIGGQARIEIEDRLVDVIIVGQQTGPSSDRDELLKLTVAEYRRWNQGMGFPDSYRKAVYCMDLAEQRGWPVVVLVDTPGADPSEYSEEEGQAFAINEVICKTTSLKVPNLAYIISLGASGGAIAITAANRTVMNQYATYMVISPGGCASILFRNRSQESIHHAAQGLCLTSADALAQGTVDEVVEEGHHPGHRFPAELLAKAKIAVTRQLADLLELGPDQAEEARRKKFFAMGAWGASDEIRSPETLAEQAARQGQAEADLRQRLAEYLAEQNSNPALNNGQPDPAADRQQRVNVARLIYAIQKGDAPYLCDLLGIEGPPLTEAQWADLLEFTLERRYGRMEGAPALHPNGGNAPYRRRHPLDWIRRLTDPDSFREFAETIQHCSVDQLQFPKYASALSRGIERTGLHSGLITGTAHIGGFDAVLAINNFGLVGSSLCDEIGEKFRCAAGQARERQVPLICVAMGGGARMQEGTPSMHRNIPKAQHALNELAEAGGTHISVIADPTLGGTAISYGLRGDYMVVVQHSANIGFSGKRVVEQFQQRKVAKDFQHGTWLLHRGFVDERVATEHLAERLAELLRHVAEGGKLAGLQTRRPRQWQPTETVAFPAASPKRTSSRKRSGGRRKSQKAVSTARRQ
ncbi:MAG: hypothetical protein GY778_27670 [bacterium]|nr:hypothetical protein [bacterium]